MKLENTVLLTSKTFFFLFFLLEFLKSVNILIYFGLVQGYSVFREEFSKFVFCKKQENPTYWVCALLLRHCVFKEVLLLVSFYQFSTNGWIFYSVCGIFYSIENRYEELHFLMLLSFLLTFS